jgi:D-amino-acid dehydrogenase
VQAGFLVPGERTVEPSSLLAGLHAALAGCGVQVLEHHRVDGFETRASRVTAVRTAAGLVSADEVVIAAGVWSKPLLAKLERRLPLASGKGYSVFIPIRNRPRHSLYLLEAKVGASAFGDSVRLAGTMELTGDAEAIPNRRIRALHRFGRQYLSGAEGLPASAGWAGLRPIAPDGLPIIGRVPPWTNVTVATAHAMLGVTLGPVTGQAVAQLICNGEPPQALKPFALDRFDRTVVSRVA